MKTQRACAVTSPSPERAVHRVAIVGPRRELDGVPLAEAPWPGVLVDRVADEAFDNYLDRLGGETLAVVVVVAEAGDRGPLRILRSRPERLRTRAYILARAPARLLSPVEDDWDVEGIVDLDRLTPEALARAVENGLRAYRALGTNPLIPEYYLDATYNRIFDWFETTKWDWRELDLSQIRRDLLTEPEIDILQESAIIEFGTLPGAHNFLREWADEYSFSSWALSWGAEEARHSLVQCRYLHEIGIEVRAKHALYKREPYPIGENRAATLMMNIISESRAAEYYKTLARLTREPVLRTIWRLLGRDESRHARAFFVFCKELVDSAEENAVAAVQMAYVWLADRRRGVKHPAGFFYPHSSSTSGLRQIERYAPAMTDVADRKVLAMIRNLLVDESVQSVGDLKAYLRSKVA
ncbi:MAG TPA: ferritin-like domain-containing protein [Candidatus Binatia bacterium]|nr:ferritin-like domain-containing protein [Candidatus Binatia bacterium]